jgi:hypothetical protein
VPTRTNAFVVSLSPAAPSGGATLSVLVTGTADPGVDYSAPATTEFNVTIPAGASNANIALTAPLRPGYQPSRTVTVSLLESDKVAVGADKSATVTIQDTETRPTVAADSVLILRTGTIYNHTDMSNDALIQAVAAANDDDVLVVGPGFYTGLQLQKNLSVLGQPGVDFGGQRAPFVLPELPQPGAAALGGVGPCQQIAAAVAVA